MTTGQLPIGLALVRPTEIMGAEPYFHELIAGIERATLPSGHSVLMRVLPDHDQEARTYRKWAEQGRVACVLIVDVLLDDTRPALVRQLGLPAVVVGPPIDPELTTVWTDDDEAMRLAIDHLAKMGHSHILHVGGPREILHSNRRREVFEQVCDEKNLVCTTRNGDYSRASGRSAVAAVMSSGEPPTAAIFDNDLMALGGSDATQAADLRVPEDLAILAWDDSAQCQLSAPPLSAVSRDVRAVGQQIGEAVLEVLKGATPTIEHAAQATVVARRSTAIRVTNP